MVTNASEVTSFVACFSPHPTRPKDSKAMEMLVANKCFMAIILVIVLVAIFAFASPKLGKIRTPRTGESGIGGRSEEA